MTADLIPLHRLSAAEVTKARAAAINAARAAGLTWRKIAIEIDMTEVGIQRIPGVNSPWNARLAGGATNEGDQQ